MFTGIIEATGTVEKIIQSGTNKTFWINSPVSHELKVDQSVAHNGVCLTVEEVKGTEHRVTAVKETLEKSNLRNWIKGDLINLERSLLLDARIDGHLVQGHVDTTAICSNIKNENGSWVFQFSYFEKYAPLIIEKGSIALNGTSLTVYDISKDSFSVTIIPYTYNFTNFHQLKVNDFVNIEFDLLGKYILRNISLQNI